MKSRERRTLERVKERRGRGRDGIQKVVVEGSAACQISIRRH